MAFEDFEKDADGYPLVESGKVPGLVVRRNWQALMDGHITWQDLDDEEVSKGRVRGKDGTFVGTAPKLVPRALADQRTRLLMERVQHQFSEVVMKATQVYVDVLEDQNATPTEKMAAAKYLQERFLGKVPDKMELSAEVKPWEGLVAGVLRTVPGED